MNERIRITVERFEIKTDERGYDREDHKETILETRGHPSMTDLQVMQRQVEMCLSGITANVPQLPQ